jgi:hypothetical protein
MPRRTRLIARAVRAPDAAQDCRRNAAEALPVLRRYGIANITSAQQEWWTDDHTCALLLEDRDTGEPLGGVRLQRWGGRLSLPLESALGPVDARVRGWVAGYGPRGVGELCGLWCSPRLRGLGLGARLTWMGIALAVWARTRTLLGLCDTRNLEANLRLGFAVDHTLASGGRFEYPRPGLIAHVLRIGDAFELPEARTEISATVREYRDRPIGREVITADGRRVVLDRDLRLA